MNNLKVYAKRLNSNEKLVGTGINFLGDSAILYNRYASYEVDPQTVLLRSDNKIEEYNNPQTDDKLISKLHERLVQTTIDFLNEHNLNDIDEVMFDADSLQESRKYNKWTPATDSSLTVIGYQEGKRKKIGESL